MDITKYGSQLFIVLEQTTVRFRQAQNTLTRMGRNVADKSRKLREALRPEGIYLWQLFRRKQNTLTIVGRSAVDTLRRLQEAIRSREKDVRKLQASSLRSIEMTKDKIMKFGSQLFIALAQVRMRLQRGQDMLTELGRSVADKPRSLQKALRSRENELRELLASSVDAIVVTNAYGSLVAANSKALDLFGVTRTNMRQFTIDMFLSHSQIQQFGGRRLPFTRRETRLGQCKIRRLDGGLRVAEYSFVANFTPFRHLCRFHSATQQTNTSQLHRGQLAVNQGSKYKVMSLQAFMP